LFKALSQQSSCETHFSANVKVLSHTLAFS